MEQQNRIQYYRKQAGLSQEGLGERLYVSRQTVSQWETGQTTPSLDSLCRLREIFGVSVDDLLGLTPIPAVPEPASPEPYCFRYTEASFRTITGTALRPYRRATVISLVLAVLFLIARIAGQETALMAGIAGGIAVFYGLLWHTFAKNYRGQLPAALRRTLAYTLTPAGLQLTTTDEEDPTYINSRLIQDIRRVREVEHYWILETDQNLCPLDQNDLPEGSPLRNYVLSVTTALRSPVPQTASPRMKVGLQVLSWVLFFGSLMALLLGLILAGIMSSANGNAETEFARYMWICWTLLPIPLASVIYGVVMTRRGFKKKFNVVIGTIMAILLGIFGSFAFTVGKAPDPIMVVEQDLGIELFGGEVISSSAQSGILGGDYFVYCNIRFTDDQEARFEAAMAEREHWLEALPQELEDLQPPTRGEIDFDRCLLYDRTAGLYNTRPGGESIADGARQMVALYYDADYNELDIFIYEWES